MASTVKPTNFLVKVKEEHVIGNQRTVNENFYRISDVATCYKLVPTSFLKETNFKENGFSFEIEILSKFLKFNKSVLEVPISYEGRSYDEGKKIKTIDGVMYLINTLRYKFFN